MVDPNSFDIGEDSDEGEEDLLDLSPATSEQSKKPTGIASVPPPAGNPVDKAPQRSVSKAQAEAANAALDPSKPLHITLPTFRMVVLAE